MKFFYDIDKMMNCSFRRAGVNAVAWQWHRIRELVCSCILWKEIFVW